MQRRPRNEQNLPIAIAKRRLSKWELELYTGTPGQKRLGGGRREKNRFLTRVSLKLSTATNSSCAERTDLSLMLMPKILSSYPHMRKTLSVQQSWSLIPPKTTPEIVCLSDVP